MALTADPAVKEELIANTSAAVARGVFGSPTFFVGEEMFFGQDRLEFVEDALQGRSYLRDAPAGMTSSRLDFLQPLRSLIAPIFCPPRTVGRHENVRPHSGWPGGDVLRARWI